MSTDFVLGIGGTGAKCVEAFMRLAACGMGPDDATVGLLDQDRSNGNGARAVRVLSEYKDVRAALRSAGGSDLGASPLFRMRLERPSAGWTWAPEERPAASLSSAMGYPALPPQEQAVVQALFNDRERRLLLDEGFRQRPALGAALTLAGLTKNSKVWQDLLVALQGGQSGEVRIFLCASIFGGTGAAGFPTLARLLRKEIEDRRLGGRVKVGGVLLLPYFTFLPPPAGSGGTIQPDSAAFLMQARGALEYYSQLFSNEEVFDRLYLVGSDPPMALKQYSDGGTNQANPPLLPEFMAALAAVDFLQVRPEGTRETLVSGVSGGTRIGWEDMPFDGAGTSGPLQEKVASALRTALAWHCIYGPALSADRWKASRREAWFRRTLPEPGVSDMDGVLARSSLALISGAFADLLRWFVALNRGGAGGHRELALVDDAAAATQWSSEAVDEVPLRSTVRSGDFSQFVCPGAGPSLAEVFRRMTYGPLPERTIGLGKVLATLHSSCRDAGRR